MTRRRWGQGTVGQEASGSWFYRLPLGGGRKKYRGGFPSKALADRALKVKIGVQAFHQAGVVPDAKALPRIAELREPYLARRERSHRAGRQDRQRWDIHMAGSFDHLRPGEVSHATIRQWVRERRAAKCSGSSLRVMLACLSGLFEELKEEGAVAVNPTKGLPKSILAQVRSEYDPETTPFVEKLEDVRRVVLALPAHVARVYALGAYAGLRPGEARALRWRAVDLVRGTVHVTEQVTGILKDKTSRMAPVMDELAPLLRRWHLESGGKGLVCPPGPRARLGGPMYRGTPNAALRGVLEALGLDREGLDWYAATRHTFASHFVLRGGDPTQLSKILGHSSLAMTARYMHLRPELFTTDVRGLFGAGHCPSTVHVSTLPVGSAGQSKGRKTGRARRK